MTLTPNYNPNQLHPKIIITNQYGGQAYTFESEQLNSTPTQDFKLESLKLHIGMDDDFGYLQLVIHDHNNVLTDITSPKRSGVIGREWAIQLYLGKTTALSERWFYGKIKDVTVARPGTNLQIISLTCVGWGIILRERLTRMVRNQAKTSDGVTLDDADNSTKIYELIQDLFIDVDHYVDDNLSRLTSITVSLESGTTGGVGSAIDTDATSQKIANVNFNMASFAQAISNLAGIANTSWYVNPDRELVVQDPEAHNSGFLFTNNLSGDAAQNWNSSKIGYLLNSPLEWSDSSADMLYNIIHGVGHFKQNLQASYETAPDASDNLDTAWHAIPFVPTTDNISKIAVRAIKTGTPPADTTVEIWGDSGGSGPDSGDKRRQILLNTSILRKLSTSTPASWWEIPITPRLDVVPNEQLYIVFPTYGDASNTININYKSATGSYYDSTDGVTWTSRTGASAYRVYSARRLITTVEHVDATALLPELRERMFPIRGDLEEQTVRETLIQAATVLGKQKRMYGTIVVSPVTSRIPVAHFCRLQDAKTGMDVKAIIKAIDLQASSSTLGVQKIELTLESYDI